MTGISDTSSRKSLREVTVMTAVNLQNTAARLPLTELTQLELPEINRITHEVARVVPAGNVPGIILNGLAMIERRRLTREENEKYINLLFRGVRLSLDRAIYSAFFAGPAAVIYGYQQLLRLTGKDISAAFPEGTWQFYLEFALREDSARHTNETTGFQTNAPANLDEIDRMAAWLLAMTHFIDQLPRILENEWRERIVLRLLAQVTTSQRPLNETDEVRFFNRLHRQLASRWERQRPYYRSQDQDYPTYRRNVFDAYWLPYYKILGESAREQFEAALAEATSQQLPGFLRQMSLLAYLQPGEHHETRVPYLFAHAHLAVIRQGRYYLVPLTRLLHPDSARRAAEAILSHEPTTPPATLDHLLVVAKRGVQARIRPLLSPELQQELRQLQHCPVILNWDLQDSRKRLANIRQGQRGIGDHPMTIFRTTDSMVFDQSHIFFDGAWGANAAQVLTNEALVWAHTLAGRDRPPARTQRVPLLRPALQALSLPESLARQLAEGRVSLGTSAENATLRMKSILSLRDLLKKRSDLAQITVNDLFILYRTIHAQLYQPSPELVALIDQLGQDPREASRRAHQAVLEALRDIREKNPSILIPIDACRHNPRERVFPTTFRNPLTDFVEYHRQALVALDAYELAFGDEVQPAMKAFVSAQTVYLRLVGGFGELLSRYKDVAMSGQSTSTTSIKFLAHLPASLRKLLNSIPDSFDILNEIIKGEEVFSNTGRVAVGATLRRFMTAKDDNHQKTLCWGVQTDDHDVARISLRDFRPHVRLLQEIGREDLAQRITQDYLDAYVSGLSVYTDELRRITVASPHATTRPEIRGLRLPPSTA